MELRATGEGLRDKGMLTTSYRVDLDGRTFFANTHAVGDLDYERKQAVLDMMMETVVFGDAGGL